MPRRHAIRSSDSAAWWTAVAAAGGLLFWLGAWPRSATPPPPAPSSGQRCAANLRVIYLASRHLPLKKRRSLRSIRSVLAGSFLITESEEAYAFPSASPKMMLYVGPYLEALLCDRDPAYGDKLGPAVSGTLDFAPSYRTSRRPGEIVYCPLHHLALLQNGTIANVSE